MEQPTRPLSPEKILDVWEAGRQQHELDRALTLLTAASGLSRDELADLTIGERDARFRALIEYSCDFITLTGTAVVSDSIARGVERGLFAYALGDAEGKQFDTIRFRQAAEPSLYEVTESAWLLRPERPTSRKVCAGYLSGV